MILNIIFFLLCFVSFSCVVNNVAMESAKTLDSGESQAAISAHYSFEHDENKIKDRVKEKLRLNDYKSNPKYGLSIRMRHGLSKNFDLGGHVSFDSLSVDGKIQLIREENYAMALSSKVQVPIFSIDQYLAYTPVVTLLNSFSLHRSLELYANPFYVFYPEYEPQRHSIGATVGFFLGQYNQFSFAYTYQQLLDYIFDESIEQVSIGFVFNNLKQKNINKGEYFADGNNIYITAGFPLYQTISLGLESTHKISKRESFDFSLRFGRGLFLEEVDEKFQNSSTRAFFFLSHYNFQPFSVDSFRTNIGLGRRELTFSVESLTGWKQIQTTSHGISLSFTYISKNFNFDILGLFIPIFYNRASYYYMFDDSWEPDSSYQKIGENWADKISWSLVRVKAKI